jgi:purine-binding chemotaxis protein CheW
MHTDISEEQGQSHEFVSFRIGAQDFCVDIIAVREIRGWTPASPLPHSPSYICGVINLRGSVLPVIDLAQRLGIRKSDPTERHVIIVTEMQNRLVGLLVDSVSDIITVRAKLIQPTPDVSSTLARSFVTGVLALEGRMLNVLTLTSVLDEAGKAAA